MDVPGTNRPSAKVRVNPVEATLTLPLPDVNVPPGLETAIASSMPPGWGTALTPVIVSLGTAAPGTLTWTAITRRVCRLTCTLALLLADELAAAFLTGIS